MAFESYRLDVEWDKDLPVYWFDNSPFKSHFMNSLSTRFHHGEKFFISAVNRYKHEVNGSLLKDLDEFILQENQHRRIHNQYDRWMASKGYPTLDLQEMSRASMFKIEAEASREFNLVMTMCLEHNTVVIAEFFFENPQVFDTMHPHFRRVWQWHAVEELEHKSVAADLLIATGERKVPRRIIQLMISVLVMAKIMQGTIILLKHDKQLWKWRTFKDAVCFFFSPKSGFFVKTLKSYFRFMKKGFHPNDVDHSALLEKYSK